MQILIVGVLSALVMGFSGGFYTGHAFNADKVHALEAQIITANANAELALKNETEKVAIATATAIESNINLDKSHEATIKALNSQHDELAHVQLYVRNKGRCSNSVSKSDSAGISQDTTTEAELNQEIDRTIKEAAIIADIAADYADKAYRFVFLTNCGIKP